MRRSFSKHTLPLIFVLLGTSCLKNEVSVKLTMKVEDSSGEAVVGALIRVNNQELGHSDNKGLFNVETAVSKDEPINIEVSKQSEAYYYAPYYDSLTLKENQTELPAIKAVLYQVPKPTAADVAKVEKEFNEVKKDFKPEDEVKPQQEVAEVTAKPEEKPTELTSQEIAPVEQPVQMPVTELPSKTIAEQPVTTTTDLPNLPVTERQNAGASIFTIHVFSGDKPVEKAAVFVGEKGQPSLKLGCKTNARGRCVLRYKVLPEEEVSLVVSKDTFQTATKTSLLKHMGQARINLIRGDTLDIFAISKNYNFIQGIPGVEVWIQDKLAGSTDRFGHLYFVYSGRKSDLIEVKMRAKDYMPEEYVTDFVVSGSMSLVRYFSPVKPPPVKMTLLKLQPAGRLGENDTYAFDGFIDRQLQSATKKYFFESRTFSKFPLASFRKAADANDLSLGGMLRKGWDETDIKGSLDVVLLPTLVVGKPSVLEISVVNSRGQVLSAAKETLDNPKDTDAIDHAVASIAKGIRRIFPFEAAIATVDPRIVTINMGYGSGRDIKVGDELEVYGVQSEEYGRKQTHKNIATLVVKEVLDQTSHCAVKHLAARSALNRGDLVVLRAAKAGAASVNSGGISVVSGALDKMEPLSQANLYFNDKWIGATDSTGKLRLNSKLASGSGYLKVIKHGYRDFVREITLNSKTNLEIPLERELAVLRVESNPSGAKVRVDGKELGLTPLTSPMAIPSGFVKLEVEGPVGFKKYEAVLDLDEGTLELTEGNKIELQKDFRLEAQGLMKKGKFENALTVLRNVPKNHPDYLLAAHERGEIYLNNLKKPVLAAKAFSHVTSDPMVKNFNDKRFVATHIDEGVAVFMVAEDLQQKEPEAAVAHYQKALEILGSVAPYLRFVSKEQYGKAVNNVEYYKALSQHRLWNQTKNQAYLNEAYKSWRSFIDEKDGSDKVGQVEGKAFVERARVYLKQAESSIATLGSGIDSSAN